MIGPIRKWNLWGYWNVKIFLLNEIQNFNYDKDIIIFAMCNFHAEIYSTTISLFAVHIDQVDLTVVIISKTNFCKITVRYKLIYRLNSKLGSSRRSWVDKATVHHQLERSLTLNSTATDLLWKRWRHIC